MAVKVLVNSVPTTRVSIGAANRDVVRTVAISSAGSQNKLLSQLLDVDASSPDNNETLVYDSATGKYIMKELPIVDGGIF